MARDPGASEEGALALLAWLREKYAMICKTDCFLYYFYYIKLLILNY